MIEDTRQVCQDHDIRYEHSCWMCDHERARRAAARLTLAIASVVAVLFLAACKDSTAPAEAPCAQQMAEVRRERGAPTYVVPSEDLREGAVAEWGYPQGLTVEFVPQPSGSCWVYTFTP